MNPPKKVPSPTDSIPSVPVVAPATSSTLRSRQSIASLDGVSLSGSETGLSFRRSNPSAASLFASTLTPPGSRSHSPVGRDSPSRFVPGLVFGHGASRELGNDVAGNPGDPLALILRAFVPHVAVVASEDTDDLARQKGFKTGFWTLLRPFGERLQGKVVVRDSNGLSKTLEDFSVRFVRFGDNIEQPESVSSGLLKASVDAATNGGSEKAVGGKRTLDEVEELVGRHLNFAEDLSAATALGGRRSGVTREGLDAQATSPYYALYLRRSLCGMTYAPHESFAQPAACIIAISSRNQSPIEELRRLYDETSTGSRRAPVWVDPDFLRYYVLLHDEDRDDITRSMALFEQMQRHFGLHCHLLRIRGSQSAETDDDSIPLPQSDWITAAEELATIDKSEQQEDFGNPTTYIYESDATAIRTFVREMVTQSIVPTMERHVSVWNDQVASRRRGITGRLMSFSRKWAGLGASSRPSAGGGAGGTGSHNYDVTGFYRAETPEAIMRRLADYAFMLRDWKLAYSTYELLRSDFSDAKAWRYYAAASEMAAISLLLVPQSMPSKTRAETVDQMLEAAFYSYNTRCSQPYGAFRALVLGIELLRLRGGSSVDDAVRWGVRLLESKILDPIADPLMKERLAVCFASKEGVGSRSWGSRRRKSAMWAILAAEAWMQQGKLVQAQRCLDGGRRMYSSLSSGSDKTCLFERANGFIEGMQKYLTERLEGDGGGVHTTEEPDEDEVAVALGGTDETANMRGRRPSMVVPVTNLETAPLHGPGEAIELGLGPGEKEEYHVEDPAAHHERAPETTDITGI